MGSYTNLTVPMRWDRDVERRLEIEKLKTELIFYKKEYESLCAAFENIPAAIEEWGFVDLKVGKDSLKLVKGEV